MGVQGPVGVHRGRYISSVGTMVVRTLGVPPHLPGYISGPRIVPHYISTSTATGAPGCLSWVARHQPPHGPREGVGRAGPPANWSDLGVSKNLSVSKTAPGLKICRRLASPAARAMPSLLPPVRAPHPPTGNWPASPRGPRRRPSGLAGRHPPPPAAAARGPPAARPERRHEGRGHQGAPAVGPPAWPVASRLVSFLPTRPLRLARRRGRPSSRAP